MDFKKRVLKNIVVLKEDEDDEIKTLQKRYKFLEKKRKNISKIFDDLEDDNLDDDLLLSLNHEIANGDIEVDKKTQDAFFEKLKNLEVAVGRYRQVYLLYKKEVNQVNKALEELEKINGFYV